MHNFTPDEKITILNLILLCRADVEVRDIGLVCQVNGYISLEELTSFVTITDYSHSPEVDDDNFYHPEMTQFVIPYSCF